MEIRKMKWLAYLMVPFVAIAISCNKDDDDDDMDNGNGGNTNDGRNEAVIAEITQTNLTKIELSTTAVTAAQDSLVRLFAQSMIAEYDQAQNDLDSIAENRDIDLASDLDNENQQLKDSLDSLSGSVFDSVYIFSQITILTGAKNTYQSIADTTEDQALLAYVNQYLPGVLANLAKADSIAYVLFGYTGGNVGNDGNGGGNGGGNDTTDVDVDTTGVGVDTTGVGVDTTGVGIDTTDAGVDTTGTGGTALLKIKSESAEPSSSVMAATMVASTEAQKAQLRAVGDMKRPATPSAETMADINGVREPSQPMSEPDVS